MNGEVYRLGQGAADWVSVPALPESRAETVVGTIDGIAIIADGMPVLPECPLFIVKAEDAYEEVERRNATVLDALPAWFDALTLLDNECLRPTDRAAGLTFSDYAILLLRTGLRASEAASMRWEDIDLDSGLFTVRDTKNGTDHTLPIVPQIAEIFERRNTGQTEGYVFPTSNKTGYLGQPRKLLDRTRRGAGMVGTLLLPCR